MIVRGLDDLDAGPVAIDLHREFGIDLTDEVLDTRSWQWILGRAYDLLNIPNTLIRKAALAHGL